MALFGFDIETKCAVEGCTDASCSHGLDAHRNEITVLAVSDGLFTERVFRGEAIAQDFYMWATHDEPSAMFTAHYGKFDFRVICTKLGLGHEEIEALLARWVHDSNLLAFTDQNKIPAKWLAEYERKRIELNRRRTGLKHREAGIHSLKTLAPYILGVEAFWEPEDGHDNDEYVLKDARYTLQLTEYYLANLDELSLKFYMEHYMPWNKMLLGMELRGVRLDVTELSKMWSQANKALAASESKLEQLWAPHFKAYEDEQRFEINEKYHARTAIKQLSAKQAALNERNRLKALSKIEPFNLGSPSQLKWLFNKRLGLGVASTDVESLQALQDKDPGIKEMLTQRELSKLCSTYFPKYKEVAVNGRIHAHFNSSTARTGRLSCSEPNLQQVPAALHKLIIADEGKQLATVDLGAIEPTMLAYFSEDPVLCDLLINGGDFHGTTAIAMFDLECDSREVKKLYPELRDVAKTVGLAVLYGAGGNRVLTTLYQAGFTEYTLADAKRMVYTIRDTYKGVWEFKETLDAELAKGTVFYNYMGRPFTIPNSDDVYMKGLNTLIQGSASDLMQEIALLTARSNAGLPLLLVHDELVAQAANGRALYDTIDKIAKSFKLETRYGVVPIKTDGKVGLFWEK